MKTWTINNRYVEFIEETHQYIVDGVLVPCVSNILAYKFDDYVGVSKDVLERAAQRGTELHNIIERYEKYGEVSDKREFKNYLFLKKHYGWENLENEVPVLYEEDGKVLFIGTTDQVMSMRGKTYLNDFKRVCSPNKEKITCQLNLYKLGYEQTYKKKIDALAFTQLREDVRKFREMPVNKEMALDLVREYYKGVNNE